MNKTLYILFLIVTTSCGISEDCFKGNGNTVTMAFPYDNFTKVKVYSGVALVVKEGPEYEVRIETRDNIKDNIEVNLEGDMLIVKDNSTCNIARDYGATTVYITAPNLEEIHSKTEQDIKSDGVLHFPELKLYSMGDDGDGAGTGDFYLSLFSNNIYLESNGVSNFYIDGESIKATFAQYWGNGIIDAKTILINNLNIYHRGSNDMKVNCLNLLEVEIRATGNVLLYSNPTNINLNEFFSGRLIYK